MSTLHRTQIYLKDEQIGQLKLEAVKTHTAISELIRRAIDYFLTKKEETVDWDKDPLTKAIGTAKTPIRDLSSRHDEYLYGWKKPC